MGSTRLRGKVIKRLAGKTVIEHIVERIGKCEELDDVIVATAPSEENIPLINMLSSKGIKIFLGSENNVLDRYIQAGEYYNADVLVRVTGDNPLTCPFCLRKMLQSHLSNKAQYTTMVDLPVGVGSEIVNLNLLRDIQKKNLLDYHKEHVTLFIRENENLYRVNVLEAPLKLREPTIRLTIDTYEDYELMKLLYDNLYKDDHILDVGDVLEYMRQNKELSEINKNVQQKNK